MDTKFEAPAAATFLLLPNITYSQHAVGRHTESLSFPYEETASKEMKFSRCLIKYPYPCQESYHNPPSD
jgi:hypothetical protein